MSPDGPGMSRRATDQGEPTNAELLVQIAEVRKALEAFISASDKKTKEIDELMERGRTAVITTDRRLMALESGASARQAWIETNTREIQSLHDQAVQLRTIASMVRYATGGSLIAAIAAIASLVLSLSHVLHP